MPCRIRFNQWNRIGTSNFVEYTSCKLFTLVEIIPPWFLPRQAHKKYLECSVELRHKDSKCFFFMGYNEKEEPDTDEKWLLLFWPYPPGPGPPHISVWIETDGYSLIGGYFARLHTWTSRKNASCSHFFKEENMISKDLGNAMQKIWDYEKKYKNSV